MRQHTDGKTTVEAAGSTVKDVLDDLGAKYPNLTGRIFDGGQLRRFVNIFLNNEDIRYLDNLATPVKDGDDLAIIPGVANYSLVVNAKIGEAVERFYALKQRSPRKPITLMVPPHDAERHVQLPAANRRGLVLLGDPIVLIGRTAPGLHVSPKVNAGTTLMGILWLNTPLHKLLYSFAECPIAGSSLNLSGEAMVTRFEGGLGRPWASTATTT